MIPTSLILLASPLAPPPAPAAPPQELVAIKARRALVGDGSVVEHAVILVDDGKIVTMGQDLPIERGIPVVELDDDQVVMPGLVNAYTRVGMSGGGYNDSRPHVMASAELYPPDEDYDEALERGVTTMAQYPAGDGIPGQAVVVRPRGDEPEDMILRDAAYLKIVMRASSSNKRNLRDGFEEVDEYHEEVEEEREKWEKKKEEAEKKKKKKKDDDDEEDEDDDVPDEFVPPEPDEDVVPFIALREGTLQALVTLSKAADYLHLLDAIGDEEFRWHLRLQLSRESDFYEVKEEIGALDGYVLIDPEITLHPGTMRQRNLPAEIARAGAKICLLPRSDSIGSFERWLEDVGLLVGAGLDRDVAVRALTQHPAEFLGLDDQVGTLAEGKRANLVVLSGDPFEAGTEVDAVMLDGVFVHGEVNQ